MPLGATARARAGHRRERLRLALDPIPVAGAGAKSRHDLRAVGESRRFFPLHSRSSGRLISRQELRLARGVRPRRPRCPRSVPAVRVSETAPETAQGPETVGCSLDGGARAVRRLLGKRRAARGSAALAGGELPAQTDDRIRERAELVRLLAVVAPAHELVTGVHGDATRDAPVRRAHHHQTLRAIQDVRDAPTAEHARGAAPLRLRPRGAAPGRGSGLVEPETRPGTAWSRATESALEPGATRAPGDGSSGPGGREPRPRRGARSARFPPRGRRARGRARARSRPRGPWWASASRGRGTTHLCATRTSRPGGGRTCRARRDPGTKPKDHTPCRRARGGNPSPRPPGWSVDPHVWVRASDLSRSARARGYQTEDSRRAVRVTAFVTRSAVISSAEHACAVLRNHRFSHEHKSLTGTRMSD